MLPEAIRSWIGVHDTKAPGAWESFPHLMRNHRAHATAAMAADDKKFGHVPRALGIFSNQREACPLAVDLDKKRVMVGLHPVEWKRRIPESAIGPRMHGNDLAEVMNIEFQQVGEDWLMIRRGWDELDAGQLWRIVGHRFSQVKAGTDLYRTSDRGVRILSNFTARTRENARMFCI